MEASNHGQIDAAEVANLYVAHSEGLRVYLKGILRDEQLAADALQATFARLIEKGHLAEPEKRRAWLFRVATNEALSIRRRRQVDEKALDRLSQQEKPESPKPAIEIIVHEESLRRVSECLHRLPIAQREVVQMRMFDDLKFAEIAERLEVPLGTVLTRMRLAITKLQRTLEANPAVTDQNDSKSTGD